MTSFNHKINSVNELQYNFSTFSENLDSLFWDMSKIFDYFHYLLTDPRTSMRPRIILRHKSPRSTLLGTHFFQRQVQLIKIDLIPAIFFHNCLLQCRIKSLEA